MERPLTAGVKVSLGGLRNARGQSVPNDELTRLLKSVGQRVFVTYYRDFENPALDTADLAGILAQEGFTEKACRSRATHARRIFNQGFQIEALEGIASSTRSGNEKTAKMASDLLAQLQGGASGVGATDGVATLAKATAGSLEPNSIQEDEVLTSIVPLGATDIDERRLSEITDAGVIARISQVVPAAADAAARTAKYNTLKNMEVYKAILPAGESLAKSKTMEGARRGFSRAGEGFGSKFSAHANFVKVDPSESLAFSVCVSSVMNVASLVVGQYYMSQVNDRLEALNANVSSLVDFHEAELQSRILSLISHVSEISRFSSTVLEDDSLRNRKQQQLDNLAVAATDLLGQVNEMIDRLAGKSSKPNPNLRDYETRIGKVGVLLDYQQVLLAVLWEISELRYLLGGGTVPSEMSHLQFVRYLDQSVHTNERLQDWHKRQIKRLDIDLDTERKAQVARLVATQAALIAAAAFARRMPVAAPPRAGYTPLKKGTAEAVRKQLKAAGISTVQLTDVYEQDVEIIIKGGKHYYMHE